MRNKFKNWLFQDARQENGRPYQESTAQDYSSKVFSLIPQYFNIDIAELEINQIHSLIDRCISGDASDWNEMKHYAPSNALRAFLRFKEEVYLPGKALQEVDFKSLPELMDDLKGEGFFVNLEFFNNSIVGYYKTSYVKYKNYKGKDTSYLFPTTFRIVDGDVLVKMVFGSVDKEFLAKKNINGTCTNGDFGYGDIILTTNDVGYHTYKLLVVDGKWKRFDVKPYVCVIEDLNSIGFPFMRIANNNSVRINK